MGQRVAEELQIPVYLYEKVATRPERKNLANIRRGQFEGLREELGKNPDRVPDYGPNRIHPTAGEDHGVKAVFQGLRRDEHVARKDDEVFEEVEAAEMIPAHTRIKPILQFTERDIWDTTLYFDIPYCELYEEGYRSLGAKTTSQKFTDRPAWEQDLENTEERAGRRQDKEKTMERLRKLGYM